MTQLYKFRSEQPLNPKDIASQDWIISQQSIYSGGLIVRHEIKPPREIALLTITHHFFGLLLSDVNLPQITRLGRQEYNGSLERGSSWIAPANVSGFCRGESTDECLTFILEPALLNQVAAEHCRQVPNSVELKPVLMIIDPKIQTIGSLFMAELQTGGLGGILYTESLANLLLIHLLRQYCTTPPKLENQGGKLSYSKLHRAIAYINDLLGENIGLADMARELNLSQYYFCRLFKQSTGLSPYQYLIQQRVERAKQLLLQGNVSIADVASAVGFSDQSQLTRHFKRRFGITPKHLLN